MLRVCFECGWECARLPLAQGKYPLWRISGEMATSTLQPAEGVRTNKATEDTRLPLFFWSFFAPPVSTR